MLCAARRDRDTPVSRAAKRHALAAGAADRQRLWQCDHRCRPTPPQLAAMLIDHRDDGNPRTYVSHVGLAADGYVATDRSPPLYLSLIHISEPTRRTPISYAVFCLKKKKKKH